jgi:hypothetical protein
MTNKSALKISGPKYLTNKGLLEDQMYQVLKILNNKNMISSSSALDTILNAFDRLEKNPSFRITDNIYDIDQHKVINTVVEPMNFALSYVAVMTEKNEIYMFLDNNRLIFVYELTNNYQPMEVYLYLMSIMGDPQYYNLNVTPILNPDTEAIEDIIGTKLIN